MKTIKLIFVAVLVLFVFKLGLYADFVDLGSDPTKIEIAEIKDVAVGSEFEVQPWEFDFAKWSPDGSYFAIDTERKEPLKTVIYSNSGVLFKRFDGRFMNWSLDSKKIVCVDYKTKRLFIYDVISGNKKELSNDPYIKGICFHEDSSYLIGFSDVNHKGGAIQSIVYKIDINTGNKTELFKTKTGSTIALDYFKYFAEDKLFYKIQYKIDYNRIDSTKRENLCRMDLNTGIENILFTINNPISAEYFKIFNDEIRIMIDSDFGSKIVLDDNGKTKAVIKDAKAEQMIKSKDYIIHGKTIVPMGRKILPNGNLLIMGKGTESSNENFIDEIIYICDLKGNCKKLDLPNPSRCIGYSPSGDVFLAWVAITPNVISTDRVYLIKPATRAFKLIKLRRVE